MSPSQLWLDLFKAALAGSAVCAADPLAHGSSPAMSPKALAEAAGNVASEGVDVVIAHRVIDAPVEKLLRAVEGLGVYSEYPPGLKGRLHAVFEAAAAVKSARAS